MQAFTVTATNIQATSITASVGYLVDISGTNITSTNINATTITSTTISGTNFIGLIGSIWDITSLNINNTFNLTSSQIQATTITSTNIEATTISAAGSLYALDITGTNSLYTGIGGITVGSSTVTTTVNDNSINAYGDISGYNIWSNGVILTNGAPPAIPDPLTLSNIEATVTLTGATIMGTTITIGDGGSNFPLMVDSIANGIGFFAAPVTGQQTVSVANGVTGIMAALVAYGLIISNP